MLCLWHVHKSWVENVVKKVPNQDMRIHILKGLAFLMYYEDGMKGQNDVEHAKQKYDDLKTEFPNAILFFDYFSKQWISKAEMWVTGFCNIPHAGQDTNVVVESYHVNMKAILATDCRRLFGRRMH